MTVDKIAEDIETVTLLHLASIEAIAYSLQLSDDYDAHDAINFLSAWNEGSWEYIIEHYPDFDINTPATQELIKESGGMPT
jgi:hypothetical protein